MLTAFLTHLGCHLQSLHESVFSECVYMYDAGV